MMTYDQILMHFQGKRIRAGHNSYKVICPCHDDGKPSLQITEKDGKILFYDHGGCATKDILSRLGLSWGDIGDEKKDSFEWRDRILYGMRKMYGDGVELLDKYDFTDQSGRYLYSKLRFIGGDIKKKEIRFYWIDRVNDKYETVRKHYSGNQPHTLYNLPNLLNSIEQGYPVYIVEGEKDVETLRKLGYTATTAGGVKAWKPDFAKYFTGAKVVILPDNDVPGQDLKDTILRDLKYYAYMTKVVTVSDQEHGDVSDYLQNHSADDLKAMIDAEKWTAGYFVGYNERTKNNCIIPDKLQDAVSRSLKYLIVRSPLEERDTFYCYADGIYKPFSKTMLKSIFRKYIPVGMAKDQILNEAVNLLISSDQQSICQWDELNVDENIIVFRNGILDLLTGNLEPHSPDYKVTFQIDCDYNPDNNEMPVFTKFINDLCSDQDGKTVDAEKKAVLQEYLGLALSNVRGSRVKKALILLSTRGNTGKSQLLNLITRLLGGKTANIPFRLMGNPDKNRFSLSPIIGARAIVVGDQTSADIDDSSVFKQLTGGDSVRVEAKGKTPIDYDFRGVMAIACNDLPVFRDDKGSHLFERLLIVPCNRVIPEEQRDSSILDKILTERTAVMNWALQGLKRLQSNNYHFSHCRSSERQLEEYRQEVDTLYNYLTNGGAYEITMCLEDMVKKVKFEANYQQWARDNEYNPMLKKNIRGRMEKLGCPVAKRNIDQQRGIEVYLCVKESEPETQLVEGEIPF